MAATRFRSLACAVFAIALAAPLLTGARGEPSVPVDYCATINTGSTAENRSTWQSEGACSTFCFDGSTSYAAAIVNSHSCWCSDLVPDKSTQVDTTKCSTSCPGWPDDWCGGKDGDTTLYVYLLNGGVLPSGTASVDGSTATQAPATTSVPKAGVNTTPSDVQTVSVVTVGGTIMTVTATPIPGGGSNSAVGSDERSGGGLAAGAIAGIVIGVLGIMALAGLGVFLMRRKRRNEEAAAGTNNPYDPHKRQVSGSAMSDARYPAGSGVTRSRSTLMPVDPRMDPYTKGIYGNNQEQNVSRESLSSLRDDQDYSRRITEPRRVLRPTNPDPE